MVTRGVLNKEDDMKMKKKLTVIAAVLLALGLTACGNNANQASNNSVQNVQAESSQETKTSSETKTLNDIKEKTDQTSTSSSVSTTPAVSSESASSKEADSTKKSNETLVVYFSATGTTKGIAEKIAGITGADTYEIKAAQEYSSADLNWNDSNSRSTKEQNDPAVRPEIGSDPVSLAGYKTIYIGYPIWWGEEPRIMDTFVESCKFDGITMIPFCTSSSSGIGRSGQNLADKAKSGEWVSGKRFGAGASEDEIRSWIDGLK